MLHGGRSDRRLPQADLLLTRATAGLYRLWVQYNQGVRDVTQFVTIKVGATANACNYNDPTRSYVARTSQECALVMAACIPGRTWFNDACGCGCMQQ